MPAERYFKNVSLTSGCKLTLEDNEFHHLVRVMRAAPGDTVELINGQGCLAQCTIKEIKKREAILEVTSLVKEEKPSFEVILAQAIPRGNRLDFILEKGTELGMTQLWLFPGDRSERKEVQTERAQTVMAAACKQCGRLWLPELQIKEPIKKWKELPYPLYFGDVNPSAPLLSKALQTKEKGIIFVVGPESGLTDHEEAKLRALNGQGVKLHSHILRTDTAALAALALITHN